MTDPLSTADQYRQEAAKCNELAEAARPAYLGDVYRRVAIRYLFMAEELSRWPERRGPPSLDALLPSTRTAASNLIPKAESERHHNFGADRLGLRSRRD
jgi:hypothetical protein